jgi:hypothetical protein
MVKFQKRKLKRPYKKKEHNYALYLVALPMKLNVKIEPHEAKVFDDADITEKETLTQEFVNISLVRNKTPRKVAKKRLH